MDEYFPAWEDIYQSSSAEDELLNSDDENFILNDINATQNELSSSSNNQVIPQINTSEILQNSPSRSKIEYHDKQTLGSPSLHKSSSFDSDKENCKTMVSQTKQNLSWINDIEIDNTQSPQLLSTPAHKAMKRKGLDSPLCSTPYDKSKSFNFSSSKVNTDNFSLTKKDVYSSPRPPRTPNRLLLAPSSRRTENIANQTLIQSPSIPRTRPPMPATTNKRDVSIIIKIKPASDIKSLPGQDLNDMDRRINMQHCLFPIVDTDGVAEECNIQRSNQISGLVIVNPRAFGSRFASSSGGGGTPSSQEKLTKSFQFDNVLWPTAHDFKFSTALSSDNKGSNCSSFMYGQYSQMTGTVDNVIDDAIMHKTNSTILLYGGEGEGRIQTSLGNCDWTIKTDDMFDINITLLGMVMHRLLLQTSELNRDKEFRCSKQLGLAEKSHKFDSSQVQRTVFLSMYELTENDQFRDLLRTPNENKKGDFSEEKKSKGQKNSNNINNIEGIFHEMQIDSFVTFQKQIKNAFKAHFSKDEKNRRHVIANIRIQHHRETKGKEKNDRDQNSASIQLIDLSFGDIAHCTKYDLNDLIGDHIETNSENVTALTKIVRNSLHDKKSKAVVMVTLCPTRKSYASTYKTLSFIDQFSTKLTSSKNQNKISPTQLVVVESPYRQRTPNEPRFFLSPSKRNTAGKQKKFNDVLKILSYSDNKDYRSRDGLHMNKSHSIPDFGERNLLQKLDGSAIGKPDHHSMQSSHNSVHSKSSDSSTVLVPVIKSLKEDFEALIIANDDAFLVNDNDVATETVLLDKSVQEKNETKLSAKTQSTLTREQNDKTSKEGNKLLKDKGNKKKKKKRNSDKKQLKQRESLFAHKAKKKSELILMVKDLKQQLERVSKAKQGQDDEYKRKIIELKDTLDALQIKEKENILLQSEINQLQNELNEMKEKIEITLQEKEGFEHGMKLLEDELKDVANQLDKCEESKDELLLKHEQSFCELLQKNDEERKLFETQLKERDEELHFIKTKIQKRMIACEIEIEDLHHSLYDSKMNARNMHMKKLAIEKERDELQSEKEYLQLLVEKKNQGRKGFSFMKKKNSLSQHNEVIKIENEQAEEVMKFYSIAQQESSAISSDSAIPLSPNFSSSIQTKPLEIETGFDLTVPHKNKQIEHNEKHIKAEKTKSKDKKKRTWLSKTGRRKRGKR